MTRVAPRHCGAVRRQQCYDNGVRILVPAPETKVAVDRGAPLDPDDLSFPSLAPTRDAVLESLIEISGEPDATRHLGVPAGMSDAVRGNVALREAPAAAAADVYGGPLFEALSVGDLDAASRRRARSWIVVISALWGAVRLGDRIPPYRLNMCGRLPRLGHLPQVWQEPLTDVLPAEARRGLVVDCRSSAYAVAWKPAGPIAERTLVVKVVRVDDPTRGASSYPAKYTRGVLARRIVSDALDPSTPGELAGALSGYFDVDLRAPERAGRSWELRVVETLD